jgi:hypothetical protein
MTFIKELTFLFKEESTSLNFILAGITTDNDSLLDCLSSKQTVGVGLTSG